MQIAHARRHATHIVDAVGEELYGVETVIKLSLAALFSGGHVLLEGNPGLGKTQFSVRGSLGYRMGDAGNLDLSLQTFGSKGSQASLSYNKQF